jgi:hypothetical protein
MYILNVYASMFNLSVVCSFDCLPNNVIPPKFDESFFPFSKLTDVNTQPHILSSQNKVIVVGLIIQLVKQFLFCNGTGIFINAFTRTRH